MIPCKADKPTYCSCWQDYPNKLRKKKERWLCVDCYEPIRARQGYKIKQKCVKVRCYDETK